MIDDLVSADEARKMAERAKGASVVSARELVAMVDGLARTVIALSQRLAAMEAERVGSDDPERFYSFSISDGLQEHDTEEDARRRAEMELGEYRDCSVDDDGWSPDVEHVEYGICTPIARATMVDRQDTPDGGAHDYTCDYQLQPVSNR